MMRQQKIVKGPYAFSQEGGFTLIELMLVVGIISILATIAYPSLKDYQQKSRRSDATTMLMQIAAKQEKYFMDNRSYAADLTNLGYSNTGAADDRVPSEHSYYNIEINRPNEYSFTLTAIPQGAQAQDTDCANFTLTNEGVKGHTGGAEQCW